MSNTSVDIYDGQRFLGHVTERDKGRRCEAFSAAGKPLGVFTSSAKAARAVFEAAHNQQHVVAA